MATIIIATDFSNASRNACMYGLQLGKHLKAEIILFNAYQVPDTPATMGVRISRFDVMKITELRLKDEAEKISYINMPPLEVMCDEGLPEKAILDIANEKEVDFIIVGMKGSGKNLKKIFGSTATALASQSNHPVIIVPEEADFTPPKNVVFANDENILSNDNAMERLTKITQTLNAQLFIVKVETGHDENRFAFPAIPEKWNKIIKELNPVFEFPVNKDISEALGLYIKNVNADMLIMMPHKHEWMELFFQKSITKKMIFNTDIPLLILPETKYDRPFINKFNEAQSNIEKHMVNLL